jgi:nucleotide-binding universal stress UspA family protein
MIDIKEIVCPFDFSDFSRHALHHAAALAKWYRAQLTLLHVQPAITVPAGPPEVLPMLIMTPDQQQQLRASLQDVVAGEVGDAVPVRIEVAEGNPAREIVAFARDVRSDLLVMGTHGAAGFERLVLGSVTEKVLRKAPCPVLTVPRTASDVMPRPPLFKQILCAVDFSDCSMRALKYATSLAQEADGCLVVVHVFDLEGSLPADWRDVFTPQSIRNELEALENERRQKLAHAVPAEATTFCKVETVMAHGTPYREILRLAKERHAELIAIGVRGRRAADLMFFGSTTNQLVRHATCPVLTIRS